MKNIKIMFVKKRDAVQLWLTLEYYLLIFVCPIEYEPGSLKIRSTLSVV